MVFLTQGYYDASKYLVKCGENTCVINFQKSDQSIFLQYQQKINVMFVNIVDMATVEINLDDNSIRPANIECKVFENDYLESTQFPYQISIKDDKKIIRFNYSIEQFTFKVCIETEGIFDDEVEPIRLDFSINEIDLKKQNNSNDKDNNRKIHFDLADYR